MMKHFIIKYLSLARGVMCQRRITKDEKELYWDGRMESGQVVESDLPYSEDDVVEPIQFQPLGVGSEKSAFPHLFVDLRVLYLKG
jgi:hypothetical protein